MNSDGNQKKFIVNEGEYPTFNTNDSRIIYQTGGVVFGNLTKELKSVDLNGKDKKVLVKSKYANRLVPSPDNNWIAFSHLHKVYIAPMPKSGKTIDLDNKSNYVPVSQLSKDAGINLHWSANSDNLNWTLGDAYFSSAINQRFSFLEGAPDSIPKMDTLGIKIDLKLHTTVL